MATQLSGPVMVVAQALFSSSADQMHSLGEKIFANDGRAFVYAKAGGTALVPGKLQQAAAENTSDQNLAVAAAAIGATQIVTTSTVTVDANEYAEGWAVVTVTPGVGYQYKISGHAAASAAVVTLNLVDPINIALTTDSRIDLIPNPFKAVVVNPTTATSAPSGVAVYPIVASQFGWLQTDGVANILNDGGSTVGTNVSASNATAGAVEAAVTAQAAIGVAMSGIASTEYGAIKLFGL